MSFNAAFLSPTTTPAQRARMAREAQEAERKYAARQYYRIANWFIVGMFILLAIPSEVLTPWHHHLIGGVACLLTSLAIMMMVNRSTTNGILTLIFAWLILPGWQMLSPTVLKGATAQYKVIEKEWSEKVFKK